jgi:hypothetical protein
LEWNGILSIPIKISKHGMENIKHGMENVKHRIKKEK